MLRGDFKGWVQKVLPAVYDESLSYQDLLYKIIHYLDSTMNEVDKLNENYLKVKKFAEDIKKYCEEYFENLDVQEEINNKLDEMTENGTLDNIIGNYITQNVEFIFPKRWDEEYDMAGDCSIIKYRNKIIMIDTHFSEQWPNVDTMLIRNNIQHIDYLIITHWHNDHYSNINNLFNNNYIDENTNFYLPGDVTLWSAITPVQEQYRAWFTQNNLTYYIPEENEILDIDGLKLKFNNVSDLDSYYPTTQDYNTCSMIITVEFKNNRFLFTGDATKTTLTKCREVFNLNKKVNLYKIAHHGISWSTDIQFIKNINPDFAVNMSSPTNFALCKICQDESIEIMQNNGTIIYPTFIQNDYLRFISDGSSIKVINGIPQIYSHYKTTIDLYVDSSINNDRYQDGTQQHPFKELLQAISTIDYNSVVEANIYLANGTYCQGIDANSAKNKVLISGTKRTHIIINGNSENNRSVIIRGCEFSNAKVTLKNLTIDTSNAYYDPVVADNSQIYMENVYIGSDRLAYSGVTLMAQNKLVMMGCEIHNVKTGIHITRGSNAYIYDTIFDTITEKIINGSHSTYTTESITVQNSEIDIKEYRRNSNSPQRLFNGNSSEPTLAVSSQLFDWIEIFYRTDDYVYASTGRIYQPYNKSLEVKVNHLGGGGTMLYNKQAKFKINDDSVVVSNELQETITLSTGETVYAQATGKITILQVVGGFNDFVSI